jgi:hypothetical protein
VLKGARLSIIIDDPLLIIERIEHYLITGVFMPNMPLKTPPPTIYSFTLLDQNSKLPSQAKPSQAMQSLMN